MWPGGFSVGGGLTLIHAVGRWSDLLWLCRPPPSEDPWRDLIDGMCGRALSGRVCRDLRSSSAARVRAGVKTVEREEAPVAIVMGLDQHRAQVTADWLDTASGGISRKRIGPADREGVRRFAAPFHGRELEVALEATTGRRFV